jgi:membrane-associated phospholipid phosphatase
VPSGFVARVSRRESAVVDHSTHLPARRPSWPVTALSAATGGGALWLAIAAVMAARSGPLRRVACEGAIAVVAARATTHAIGRLVRRRRPSAADLPAYQALLHKPTSWSFPSAHTAIGAAFTTAVMARQPGWGLGLTPIAVAVAYSRIRTRAHWPTDVAAGALWGVSIGAAVHKASRHWADQGRSAFPRSTRRPSAPAAR